MGWWSVDILGGDTPLDFKGAIYEQLNLDQFKSLVAVRKSAFSAKTGEEFNDMISSIIERWGCGELGTPFNNEMHSIGYQVLAVEIMDCGATIPEETLAKMAEWIPKDPWSQEDTERREKVNELIYALNVYDGVPLRIRSKGLMEVFSARIQKDN
jgi:hypothetical protein